jgi:hypothetical protein
MSEIENKEIDNVITFRKALKRLLNSEDGKIVIDRLVETYVDPTVLVPDSEMETWYRLGQKEFIQGLIKDSKEDIQV